MQLLQEQQLMLVSKDLTQQQIIKGKRTKRQRLPSPLRLAMSCNEGTSNYDHDHNHNERNSKGIDFTIIKSRHRSEEEKEEEDMANCLILLAQGRHHHRRDHNPDDDNKRSSNFYLYQCKTCNRCFPSFQALGGHRASHSKPNKPNCNNNVTRTFVDDHYDPTMNTILSLQAYTAATPITTITTTTNAATKKSKIHECSICGAEFSSGQALGGHMRRHRTLVNTSTTTTTAATTSLSMSIGSPKSHEAKKPRNVLKLDLNLPAPEVEQRDQSKFSFQPRENVIAFSSNSSLVDCHF
ncbi:zinc finger protein ZAT5 [Lathyrus oleraceus]|uniref:C2H2-type domain-containing protein n=1 Tax=Pisum sativum TaxID=3888 RepID=A0A9D5A5Y7_PEA|nr:zinc finger protein ZAT5-like [Pisum sativum]KAI5395723.1 hypothetical protein KIW84_062054 [Pisum sativum]